LAPEVVQTSAMDCGPASLKCLLEGFGISASYGRLREACQTDVDGTSIDTIEGIAGQLGLEAEQVMIPPDHVLLDEANALPAIAVVRQPNGFTHFVVVWARRGRRVQLMDPASGRRFVSDERFLQDLYHHTMPVPAEAWRDWAGSEEFRDALLHRLTQLGPRAAARKLLAEAEADPGWRAIATLDAATRMITGLVHAGGVGGGRGALRLLTACAADSQAAPLGETNPIPPSWWSVRPGPTAEDGTEQLLLSGAVLVRVLGRRLTKAPGADAGEGESPPLSPELVRALEEPPARPGRTLLGLLHAGGAFSPALLLLALLVSVGGTVFEALLFRGFFDLAHQLGLVEQRALALGALGIFLAALLALELPIAGGLQRLGRRLDVRLRLAFLAKIPKLGDRYFQSRPTSDMAMRGHSVHGLRHLPQLGSTLVLAVFELAATTAGIIWLDARSAPLAIGVAVLAVVVPLVLQSSLTERDLRVRVHQGALSTFYLDALKGLVAVRTHCAERALRREHEGLLVDWTRAGKSLQRWVVLVEGMQLVCGFGLAGWLLFSYLAHAGQGGAALLLVYWALNLPALGQEIALSVRQFPLLRNDTLLLLEPLGAREETRGLEAQPPAEQPAGAALRFEGVEVQAAGHTILNGIDLEIAAGSQVAIVGPSGAGKSSLVGLLLGWHRASAGRVLVDGELLEDARLALLRRQTAWVDPAVQLWNRSFLDNLRYGSPPESQPPIASAVEGADLHGLLARLPEGLQTRLGEDGGLVSGGEGQRVRLGRALLRPGARLVVLDEPFRGLDREHRRTLLARTRVAWQGATLLCVTHDVSETQGFERVLVIEDGRIVEDGAPSALGADPGSRYRALLDAEETLRRGLWASGDWRKLRVERGQVEPDGAGRE
jgi:ATP-binding cassette subfamily B protein